MSPTNSALLEAESGISSCENYDACNGGASCDLALSSVEPGDIRRGSRKPRVLIITEAPDKVSSEEAAYSGGLSKRLISIFCDEKYGIGLGRTEDVDFPEFLSDHRFYATSAIKCHISGGGGEVGNYVIPQCRNRYLDEQIEALNELELIIPMGNVAAASLTRQSISSVSVTSLIGHQGQGIFPNHGRYNLPVVLLPHPSGNNPYANPPIIDASGNADSWAYKIRFRHALTFIREVLRDLDYDVFRNSPSSWERPPGLSEFS